MDARKRKAPGCRRIDPATVQPANLRGLTAGNNECLVRQPHPALLAWTPRVGAALLPDVRDRSITACRHHWPTTLSPDLRRPWPHRSCSAEFRCRRRWPCVEHARPAAGSERQRTDVLAPARYRAYLPISRGSRHAGCPWTVRSPWCSRPSIPRSAVWRSTFAKGSRGCVLRWRTGTLTPCRAARGSDGGSTPMQRIGDRIPWAGALSQRHADA